MSTSFIILRHGETVENASGRWQGQLDGALTALGVAQASAAGRRLAGCAIDALYASDLGRTRHTAQLIAEHTGHTIQLDARLRERHFGVFQGLTMAEMTERYPQEWAAYSSHDPAYAPPGGESMHQLCERSLACFSELADRHAGGSVLVITHGGVLNCLLRTVLGLPFELPRRFSGRHTAFNRFVYSDKGGRLETWGDVSHLTGLTPPD
jgi:probable phosphoglycerate mutase